MGVPLSRNLKGEPVQSPSSILPGYTKIALVLSTLINKPPVFFFSLYFFFLEATHTQLMSELLDSKMVAIK